jgi:hypothetical protein
MCSQRLWGPRVATPEDVVGWLGALQAQEFPFAKWSVAQRASGVSEGAVDAAFAAGTILRTHLLRPTWHFVLREDIRWLLDLTAPRVHAVNATYYRKFGLDDALLARSHTLLTTALEGGRHRTRKELAAILDAAGITVSGLQLGYLLMHAELDAVICSGAPRGKQQTYAAFDERVPDPKTLARDEALAELTGRYFSSRGPATLKDFVRWSGLTMADGRSGLDAVGSELQKQVVGGRTYWSATFSSSDMVTSTVADLVQVLDEYVMSYSESRDLLLDPLVAGATRPDESVFLHGVLMNGQVVGHWKPVPKRNSVIIETSLYRPLNDVEARALADAAARFGQFKGIPAAVVGADRT